MTKGKKLFLMALSIEEDLFSMQQELYHLTKKYSNDNKLKDFLEINKNYRQSKTMKITLLDINKIQEEHSQEELETFLCNYHVELKEIETWLNDIVKEYLKNNFPQNDLIVYYFEK